MCRGMLRTAVTVAFLLVCIVDASAQELSVRHLLAPGTRVRVQFSSGKGLALSEMRGQPLVGTLVASRGNTIELKAEGSHQFFTVPLTSVEKLEISRGRKRGSSAGRGALTGIFIGGLSGALLGLASGDDPPEQWFAFSAEEKALMGALGLGSTGGLVGALLGYLAAGENWVEVPRESMRLDVAPLHGTGVGLSLELAF